MRLFWFDYFECELWIRVCSIRGLCDGLEIGGGVYNYFRILVLRYVGSSMYEKQLLLFILNHVRNRGLIKLGSCSFTIVVL